VSRDISFENFKQFFCPKIFSYKKEYCFDTCKKSVFQTRRIGLLVEDIEAMEDKVLLDDIIIKNESGEAINYDERAVAFLCIDQLKALYKKYIDYKITLKKENNFIVKIKKKIDTVESEIEDYKRILESA
jgi:hypothetical protein